MEESEKEKSKLNPWLRLDLLNRIKIVLFLIPLFFIAYYVSCLRQGQVHYPINVPFNPSVSGETKSIDVPVKEHRTYWLSLGITFDPKEEGARQKVLSLLHLPPSKEYAKLRESVLKLRVLVIENDRQGHSRKVNESIVDGLEKVPIGGTGYGHDFAQVTFYTVVLQPGLYKFQVEVLEGNEKLSKEAVYLQVGFHPKSTEIKQ